MSTPNSPIPSATVYQNAKVIVDYERLNAEGKSPQLAVYNGRLFIYVRRHDFSFKGILGMIHDLVLALIRDLFYTFSTDQNEIDKLRDEVHRYVVFSSIETQITLQDQIQRLKNELQQLNDQKAATENSFADSMKASGVDEAAAEQIAEKSRQIAGLASLLTGNLKNMALCKALIEELITYAEPLMINPIKERLKERFRNIGMEQEWLRYMPLFEMKMNMAVNMIKMMGEDPAQAEKMAKEAFDFFKNEASKPITQPIGPSSNNLNLAFSDTPVNVGIE